MDAQTTVRIRTDNNTNPHGELNRLPTVLI